MKFNQYLNSNSYELLDVSNVTFETYCGAIDSDILNEGFFDSLKDLKLSGALVKVFKDLKSTMVDLSKQFGLGIKDIVIAFKNRDVFNLLKAVGFNIGILFKSINALSKAVRGGLFYVFTEISKSGMIKKIQSGAMKVDEILNKYPMLKKIGGIVVAGILLYVWLNMTFIGDLDFDFNFSDLVAALHGSFSIADLFASPSGLMMITLFGTGSMLGLSVPWLGKSVYNLTLAIVYTGFVKMKSRYPELKDKAMKMKNIIKGKG